jgi:hypothetical protein
MQQHSIRALEQAALLRNSQMRAQKATKENESFWNPKNHFKRFKPRFQNLPSGSNVKVLLKSVFLCRRL